MDWNKAIAEIDERMKSVAAERDKIDALIGDLTELEDNCREAWDDLYRARDALSKLV